MTVKGMDHVGMVVNDLKAATEFFLSIGLVLQDESEVEGEWVDRIIGLEGVLSRVAYLETPDGHSHIELSEFRSPPSPEGDQRAPANAPGLRHLSFLVDDLDAVLAELRAGGVELVGEVEQYEDVYRLCYVWGPGGIIVELAEALGGV
jgi:catechol 2,3-dioxygenase-like lactoylglutathione lyase family enzyme